MLHTVLSRIQKDVSSSLLTGSLMVEQIDAAIQPLLNAHQQLAEELHKRFLSPPPLSEAVDLLEQYIQDCTTLYLRTIRELPSRYAFDFQHFEEEELTPEALDAWLASGKIALKPLLKKPSDVCYPSAFPKQSEEVQHAVETLRLILFVRGLTQHYTLYHQEWKEHSQRILRDWNTRNVPPAIAEPLPALAFHSPDFAEEFAGFVQQGHPVKITGFVQDLDFWKLESLCQQYGDELVPMFHIPNYTTTQQQPLRTLLEQKNTYVANSDVLFTKHPELTEQLPFYEFEAFLPHQDFYSAQLFLGATQKSGSPLHCGYNSNIFFQLDGEKLWLLFDPWFAFLQYILMHPTDGISAVQSVGEEGFEYEHLPLLKYCPRYKVHLAPGDILYNPYYWYHTVENLTEHSVAVATRFSAIPGFSFRETCPFHNMVQTLLPHSFGSSYNLIKSVVLGEEPGAFFEKFAHGRVYAMTREEMLEAFAIQDSPGEETGSSPQK